MQNNLQELRVQRGIISKQGNLTAYTATGKDFYIKGELLKSSFAITDLSKLTYPFYAIMDVKEYTELDKDRKPILDADGNEKKFLLKTAVSVFKTREELLQASIEDDVHSDIMIEKKAHFAQKMKSANLTTSDVLSLESAI
jgi:hypothetical protein